MIKQNDTAIIYARRAAQPFLVSFENKNGIKQFSLHDVDHWFGIKHTADVTITNDAIIFKRTRNERFELEIGNKEK